MRWKRSAVAAAKNCRIATRVSRFLTVIERQPWGCRQEGNVEELLASLRTLMSDAILRQRLARTHFSVHTTEYATR